MTKTRKYKKKRVLKKSRKTKTRRKYNKKGGWGWRRTKKHVPIFVEPTESRYSNLRLKNIQSNINEKIANKKVHPLFGNKHKAQSQYKVLKEQRLLPKYFGRKEVHRNTKNFY